MSFHLEIISGDMVGQKFPIQEGFRIGRSVGDLILRDSKISSLHAQIEAGPDGYLLLVDRNSSNGIWVGEERLKSIKLLHGVIFRVGRVKLKVVEVTSDDVGLPKNPAASPSSAWRTRLTQKVPELLGQDNPQTDYISAFERALSLKVKSGPQLDVAWTLGYGPRRFGSSSLDFKLEDSVAPHLAFEIIPLNGRPLFRTKEENVVLLNGRSIDSAELNEGDVISFGSTRIEVSLLK